MAASVTLPQKLLNTTFVNEGHFLATASMPTSVTVPAKRPSVAIAHPPSRVNN